MPHHPFPLPYPEMAAYWQTFRLAGEEPLPLACTPNDVTDAIVAFAVPDAEGVLRYAGPDVPAREAVRGLQDMGQNVLLSIGGGGVAVALDTPSKVERFAESLYEMLSRHGYSGVDIDVEQGIPASGTPLTPEGALLGLIEGLERVLALFPARFMLTMAPETANLVGGITAYEGAWGNYLPLLLHFGERVTRVHMQFYNSGPMTGLDGAVYEAGTVPFIAAMFDAAAHGFCIADTGVRYPGLPPWKLSIGLPAVPRAAGNGYLTSGQIDESLDWLRTGYRGQDQPAMPPYERLGGLMTWSLQWDATNDFAFVRHGARALGLVREVYSHSNPKRTHRSGSFFA